MNNTAYRPASPECLRQLNAKQLDRLRELEVKVKAVDRGAFGRMNSTERGEFMTLCVEYDNLRGSDPRATDAFQ